MHRIFFSFLFSIITMAATAGEEFPVSAIPAALMKNVNAVKRLEQQEFRITEDNKAVMHYRVVYTILNEQGDRWGSYAEGYDKFISIESFYGNLYDAAGKKIRSLKKSDIKDVSGNDDVSLIDDNRLKWHSFFYKLYPYTVEYELVLRYKGTMFMPRWIPQERPVMSVQQSSLTIIAPASNPLHYKMFNYKGEPAITDDKADKKYYWEVKDLEGVKSEYAAPAWHRLTTSVFMATEKFVLDDYNGSNASWKDFGRFVYDLKKDRDQLPDAVKQKVKELTNGITDVNEKISKLYNYMQQNTRYIGIQLGVGGWQPFDANYVANKKYGDCKALTNFMYALLKEAGIRSVYTLIRAGEENKNAFFPDLPSSQFTHVILMVPMDKDTTWLECTSQTLPSGYLSGFTAGRYALAVDENGGTLIRTPDYGLNDNLEIRHIKATIDENGDLDATVTTKYQAEQQDRLHSVINNLSKEKLMEFLREDIELPSYDIKKFNYQSEAGKLPRVNESLELVANNYATITGKRLFIIPNLITRTHRRLTADTARRYDIEIGFAFKDIDSVEIELPPGYQPEALPQPVSISAKFGKYSNSVRLDNNKLYYYRSYEHNSGNYPAADFTDLVKFYESIYKADRSKVVLVKKTE